MTTCLGAGDDGSGTASAKRASLEVHSAAEPHSYAETHCGEASQDEGSAPQQPLLHAFSTPVGGLLLVAGVVMIVLPGPSLPLFIVGLGLLGREYEWARRILDVVSRRVPERMRRFITLGALPVGQGNVRPSDAS